MYFLLWVSHESLRANALHSSPLAETLNKSQALRGSVLSGHQEGAMRLHLQKHFAELKYRST